MDVPLVMGLAGSSGVMDTPAFSFVEFVCSSPVVHDSPVASGGEVTRYGIAEYNLMRIFLN